MNSLYFTVLAYLRYLRKARGSHALHSPFVYQFYSEVITLRKQYYAFGAMDALRAGLMQSEECIKMRDLGAGSKTLGSERTVGQIARKSTVSKKEGELLFRVVNALEPNSVVELGTSIGVSALYMAAAHRETQVHTIEGCPQTARVAEQHFKQMGASNITAHVGDIDDLLPTVLREAGEVGLAYLDANHAYKPTMRYFEQILPAMSAEGVLIFDDIHWSEEMERAWNEICQHPAITVSIDLFSMGFAFVSKKLSKEHFVLRF